MYEGSPQTKKDRKDALCYNNEMPRSPEDTGKNTSPENPSGSNRGFIHTSDIAPHEIEEVEEVHESDQAKIVEVRKTLGVNRSKDELRVAYSLDDSDHAIAKEFQPRYIAHGGNQIVFDLPHLPHLVAKADAELLRQIIGKNIENGLPPDALNNKKEVMEHLKRERLRFRLMEQHFGKEHVLSQARVLRKVPVTDGILAELYDGHAPVKTSEAWTAITLQERATELSDEDRLDLVTGYAEIQPKTSENISYDAITKSLVQTGESISLENFLSVQNSEGLTKLARKMEEDVQLRDMMREVVRKIVAYSNDTGEILDLAGSDNLVISQKEGKWTYRLLDTLYPGEFDRIDQAEDIIQKLAEGKSLEREEQACLLNTLNYARTVNGLASYLQMSERIVIVPQNLQNQTIDYRSGLADIIKAHQ